MSTQDVAQDLIAMWNRGEFAESGEKYWADDVISREPMEGDMAELHGKDAVRGKGEWWAANHEVHGCDVTGPFVNGDAFIVRFTMDVTPKDGQRMSMDEMGLYVIEGGLIVEETFFYGGSAQG